MTLLQNVRLAIRDSLQHAITRTENNYCTQVGVCEAVMMAVLSEENKYSQRLTLDQPGKVLTTKLTKRPKGLNGIPLVPTDGGSGWVVLIGSCISLFSWFIANSMGMLLIPTMDRYQASVTEVGLIPTLQLCFSFFLAPVTTVIVLSYSMKLVLTIGAILFLVVSILCYVADSLLVMQILYGGVGGLCGSMVLFSILLIVNYYFEVKRALAINLTMGAMSIGRVAVPYLLDFLLTEYGYRGTILLLGAISTHCLIGSSLFHVSEHHPKTVRAEQSRLLCDSNNIEWTYFKEHKQQVNLKEIIKKDEMIIGNLQTILEALKHPMFFYMMVPMCICSALNNTTFIYLPLLGVQLGMDSDQIKFLQSSFFVGDIAANILLSAILLVVRGKDKYIFLASQFLAVIGLIGILIFRNFWMLVAAVFFFELAVASGAPLVGALFVGYMGHRLFAHGFGIFHCIFGAFVLALMPLINFIQEQTGSSLASFSVFLFLQVISAIACLFEPLMVKRKIVYERRRMLDSTS